MRVKLCPERTSSAELLQALESEWRGEPDPTLLPPPEGRRLVERLEQRWNRNLPQVASATAVIIPLRAALSIAEEALVEVDQACRAVHRAAGGGASPPWAGWS